MADYARIQSDECALRERVKELTCLYNVARVASGPDRSLAEILRGIVEILPGAWQYPEAAVARIVLDGMEFSTGDFPAECPRQSADIIVNGLSRGSIEIGYGEGSGQARGGSFLAEEQNLLNEVAHQTAMVIERKEAEDDKLRLSEQLRHADRLATVGVLAAGVAHELNEPLGNILGYAQLARKCEGLPAVAKEDIEKIERASLHSRAIIRKLLVYAGQVPAEKRAVDINEVVEEGLYFFHARCAKEGIELLCELCEAPPPICGDPVQLNQVLVNLVVNALQCMSGPGRIVVSTRVDGDDICLAVEDTGPGIDKSLLDKIFVPFFTTKEMGHGTGLGLPVVHGIVNTHGGTLTVASEAGKGSRFEIRLPIGKDAELEESS